MTTGFPGAAVMTALSVAAMELSVVRLVLT
ncbi:hypothetical protein AB7M16_002366 [Bradyrhizobium sp. USDA 372]